MHSYVMVRNVEVPYVYFSFAFVKFQLEHTISFKSRELKMK